MSAQTFKLTVPTKALINSNHRPHWRVKADKVRSLRTAFALVAHGNEPMTKAHATCHLSFGDNRRRDPNNWAGTAKAAIDGIVQDAGLLPDDDHAHLIGPDMRIGPTGTPGRVTITITFQEIP